MSTATAAVRPDAGIHVHADPARNTRIRVTILASVLSIASVAVAAMLLWHPGPSRDDLSYAGFAPDRDATWIWGLVDGFGLIVAAFGVALAVCRLVRARGAGFANAGAVLVTVGGVLFGGAVFAWVVLGWYATSTDAIPAGAGTALISYVNDQRAHLVGPQIVGFVGYALGLLLLAVALWRSATVPRWLPIVLGVLVIGQFVVSGRALDVEQAVLLLSFAVIGWFAVREAR